ncbi:MAG: glycosyltransferase family 2 protein [Chloroflexi bacterium]|nr:glycosyltransferase family 2 protein [Chloroflexota bacterium]
MYKERKVGVVVPAYNEEALIRRTLETMPDFVDAIIVVDDHSRDQTSAVTQEVAQDDPRITLIRHPENRGVGGAISTGYIWCREHDIDAAAVMAGDNQMHPDDLPALLDPVVEGRADYSKGNRLVTGEAWQIIPRTRYLGNSMLSFLTKIASGYWHVADSQTGYTVLGKRGLTLLPLESIYPRYGMPNDFLVTCNIYNLRVMDVPVRPVYGEEKSGINMRKIVFTLSLLLIRLFFRRMVQKYIIRDFHPLILFYLFGAFLLLLDLPLLVRFFYLWSIQDQVPEITLLGMLFCTISGMQLLLFAMLFDMEANQHLKGKSD